MAYMLNSLSVFKGQGYHFLDPPGMPVSAIGTVLLAVTFPLAASSPASFVEFHLQRPEIFLALTRGFITLMVVAGILLIARNALERSGWFRTLAAAGIAVSFFAVHPDSARFSLIWSHHAFHFPVPTLMLLALLVRARTVSGPCLTQRQITFLGAASGLLLATVLYYAPWVLVFGATIVAMVICDGGGKRMALRSLATFSVSACGVFVVALLPAAGVVGNRLGWWFKALTSSGSYGSGPRDFDIWSRFATNIAVAGSVPELLVASVLAAGLVCLAVGLRRERLRRNRALLALALGLLSQLVLALGLILSVIPHCRPHYLLVVASILPALLATALTILGARDSIGKVAHVAVAVLAVLGFGRSMVAHTLRWEDEARRFAAVELQREQTLDAFSSSIGKDRNELRVVWDHGHWPVWARCAALWYGDAHVAGVYLGDTPLPSLAAEIDSICPNERLFYRRTFLHVPGEGWQHLPPNDLRQVSWPWDVLVVENKRLTAGSSPFGHDHPQMTTLTQNGEVFAKQKGVQYVRRR